MAQRIAKINANGRIHDDDSGDIIGGDEEEAYTFSKNIVLRVGDVSRSYEDSKTVDGEVRLTLKLDLQADPHGIITVSGLIELEEGPRWNMGASDAIDATHIPPGKVQLIYDDRVEDDEGDWATVKLEVTNAEG